MLEEVYVFACGTNSVVIDLDESGKLLETKTCVTCTENTYPGA